MTFIVQLALDSSHTVQFLAVIPSPLFFAYCKRSKTGGGRPGNKAIETKHFPVLDCVEGAAEQN